MLLDRRETKNSSQSARPKEKVCLQCLWQKNKQNKGNEEKEEQAEKHACSSESVCVGPASNGIRGSGYHSSTIGSQKEDDRSHVFRFNPRNTQC